MTCEIVKEFIIKKGSEDWKVWNKVNNWLSDLMIAKRRRLYQERRLKKDVKIKVVLNV